MLQERIMAEQFMNGLDYTELQVQVKLRRPKTLREVLLAAFEVEKVF